MEHSPQNAKDVSFAYRVSRKQIKYNPGGGGQSHHYELLGFIGYHDNCTDNLAAALGELGLESPETPSPWNLFMNIPVKSDGSLTFEPPVSQPGDYVLLRAEMDGVIAFSACPQDVIPINGVECQPTEAHFQILPSR